MLGGVGAQALDLDLDRQQIGIGLGEDARRHEAALGEQFERARQDARLGVGFETVSDGGCATLEREARRTWNDSLADGRTATFRFAVQTEVLIRRPRRSMRAMTR